MLIQTADITPTSLSPSEAYQCYCGLDSCLTLEVWQELGKTYQPPAIYNFEKALQAPYLELMQRGFKVDQLAREAAARDLRLRLEGLQQQLDYFASAMWDKTTKWSDKSWHSLNPRSPLQLQEFFYGAMRIPEIWISQKGVRKLSLGAEVLEKIEREYLHARPFVRLIMAIREIGKQLDVLEKEIDPDGRWRSSYNVAGTTTGRPSSSASAFGTGSNAQNIAPGLRFVFCADAGYKLCVIDLEQVEARDCGFFIGCLFDDWQFLDNCESGDLHTNNCKLIWPGLPWTGESKKDKELAEQPFYREYSFRDMAKKGGHLCLTEDHEVLTPNGWVGISEKPPVVANWSKCGKITFAPVQRWNTYTADNLLEVEGRYLSVKGTLNHKMPVFFGRDKRIESKSLAEIKDSPFFYAPTSGTFVGGDKAVPAKLIAAFQADGSRDKYGNITWHFKKLQKIARIQMLLDAEDIRYSIYHGTDGTTRFYVPRCDKTTAWKKACNEEILEWTKNCLKEYCAEQEHWDGYRCPNGTGTTLEITNRSRTHCDWLCTAYYLIGEGAFVTVTKGKYWKVTTRHSQTFRYTSTSFKQHNTAAEVFCPTTDTGFFIVRRNGRIFISGNSNYFGTAWTASRHLKCPLEIMEEFQARYCRGGTIAGQAISPAFPGIPKYWTWVADQLQTTHQLTTPFGRRRHFFGRPGDDTTLREAIAYLPQSTTADRMNLGLWRVWKREPRAKLLAQTHDSITFQYKESCDENDIIQSVMGLLAVELRAPNGRSYVVPGEAKIGWNWGRQHNMAAPCGPRNRYNPEGLIKWNPAKPDERRRATGLARSSHC